MNYDLLNSLNKTKNCNILQNIASIYSTCHAWSRWYTSERIKWEQLNYQGTSYKWKMNVIVDITLENRNFRNIYISNTDIMAPIDRRIEWFTIENVDV